MILTCGIEDERGLFGAPVSHDAGGQDLEVDLAEEFRQRVVEDALELDAFLLVDGIDLLLDLGGREAEARVHHGVDGGVDRVLLHAHEIGEGVVEVEDDGFDHVYSRSVVDLG